MTKHEVEAKMKAAGVQGEITGRRNGMDWQVEFTDELQMWNFRNQVARIGGFKTGYGTWILCPLYAADDLKDRTKDFQRDFITGLPGDVSVADWRAQQ